MGLGLIMVPMLTIVIFAPRSASSSFLQSTPDIFGTEQAGQDVFVPSSWDCMIPRTGMLDILSTLNKVEYARYSDRLGTVPISSLVRGEPLTGEDTDGISWTLYQIAACANSLDPLTVMPLLSANLQAALVDTAVNSSDLGSALEELPLLASEVASDQGVPMPTVLNAWYWDGTTKVIDAIVEVPLPAGSNGSNPQLLVTFIWDKSYWVIDRVWIIEL
jgi:hypothetical protein